MLYEFVIEYTGGRTEEASMAATSQKEARRAIWESMTEAQKNCVAEIECVND